MLDLIDVFDMVCWNEPSFRMPKVAEDVLMCVTTLDDSEVMMGYYNGAGEIADCCGESLDWFCYNYDRPIKTSAVTYWAYPPRPPKTLRSPLS